MSSTLRLSNDPAYDTLPGLIAAVAGYKMFASGVDTMTRFAKIFCTDDQKRQLDYGAQSMVDFASPQNYFLFNVEAQREALRTGGQSLFDGAENFLKAALNNEGLPQLVDSSDYKIGENVGVTPGLVVFRGRLFELIRYSPTTMQVHEVPMLIVPPPINKYVIMDMSPGKSLVEALVAAGYTVYLISWRSADKSMSDISYADYVTKGVTKALDIVGGEVNVVSLCLGGTLAAMANSLEDATGKNRIKSLMTINTLTDFSGNTGVMGAMIDQKLVDSVWKKTSKIGYLPGEDMNSGFRGMKPEDLILRQAREQWQMGQKPSNSNLLAWNEDGTNLPALMHNQYLTTCYLDNDFANNRFKVGRHTLKIATTTPKYGVVAFGDHIVPWETAVRGMLLMGGEDVRIVGAEGGHIGAVFPSPRRARYRDNQGTFSNADSWLDTSTQHEGSWVPDYINWVKKYSGSLVAPPAGGKDLGAAPGTYVLAK